LKKEPNNSAKNDERIVKVQEKRLKNILDEKIRYLPKNKISFAQITPRSNRSAANVHTFNTFSNH
jgi:hypothetical protein